MSQEYRVVPAALLESALKTLAGVAPGRFSVEAELRAIVDAPVPPAGREAEVLASIWHGAPGEVGLLWSHIPAPAGFVRKIELVDRAHVTRIQAENAALQQRLNEADKRVDELERNAKLYDQLQRGAELLPEGWMITVEIERDGGGVTLIDPQGNDLDYPSNRESMGDEVEDAIEEALAQQVAL